MHESKQHLPAQVPQLTCPPQPSDAAPQTWPDGPHACGLVSGVQPQVSGLPPPPQVLKPVQDCAWVPPDPLQVVAVLLAQLTCVPAG